MRQVKIYMAAALKGAEILFSGIGDIHSNRGLSEIVERYKANQRWFEECAPRIVQA